MIGAQLPYTSIVLVNQTNGYTLYYDLTNRIECHNYTDIWGYPLVTVADDFVIPVFMDLNMTSDCAGISFNFTTIRLKVDTDPYSITTRLFYHDSITNGPRNTPFFTRTQCSPDNTCRWPTRLNVPMTTTIMINNGDLADDKVTPFDLASLPQGQTLWASIYVSVPDHPSTSILRENSLFWMTLDNKSTSSPLQTVFYNETPNYHYKYIDVNNLHRNGFTSWTDATVVQPILGIYTNTFNMAWTVSIICNGSNLSILPIIEPTPMPTSEPTTSTPTMAPTLAPSVAPTSVPTNTMVPTFDNETTIINGTEWYEKYIKDKQAQVILYAALGTILIIVILSCLVCLCMKYYRYRKKHNNGVTSLDKYLGEHKDRDIELGPISSSYSDFHREQDGDQSQTLKKRNLPVKRTWTDKETFSTVSLSDQDEHDHLNNADEKGELGEWINNIVPLDVGVIDTKKTM